MTKIQKMTIAPKNNSIFSYATQSGYAIIEIEHPGKSFFDIENEANQIARAIFENKEYSTDLSIVDVRTFITDGWPFSFFVEISRDRQTAKVEVKVDDGKSVSKTETITYRVK